MLLAQRAVDAIVELELVERERCPICREAARTTPGGLRATR